MTMPSTLRLAWRLLRRDWRAGELRVLAAALVLAVASVGTVGFFAERVKGALTAQANLLLGGDLMISGDRPLPAAIADTARARGLATTPAIRFNSMVQPGAGAARRCCGGAHRREGGRCGLPAAGRSDAGRGRATAGRSGHRDSAARRRVARRASRAAPRRARRRQDCSGREFADGGGHRAAGARGRGHRIRTGTEAAAESRRRAGHESPATGQSGHVASARRRSRRRRQRWRHIAPGSMAN